MKSAWIRYIIITIILAGILIRFLNLLEGTGFKWDQENLVAYPAKNIIATHHLPLIGARTSIGDIHIGPLYSYLAAFYFYIFKLDPIAAAYLSTSIGVISALTGYILIKILFDDDTALFFTLIFAVSPLIVFFDRIPWNVNLLLPSSILVLVGLLFIGLKNRLFIGFTLLGLGIFLGLQSHFSIIIIGISALLYLLLKRKLYKKPFFLTIMFIALGLLPLIIFDLRHDAYLLKNILKLMDKKDIYAGHNLLKNFFSTISISFETVGRLFIYDGPSFLQKTFAIGLLLIFIFVKKTKEMSEVVKIILIYLLGFFGILGLYSGPKPDYYFFGLLPPFILLLSLGAKALSQKNTPITLLLITFAVSLLVQSFNNTTKKPGDNLSAMQKIVKTIKKTAKEKKVSIVYEMDYGNQFGYDYLFDFYGVKRQERKDGINEYWISFPKSRSPFTPDYTFGQIGLLTPLHTPKIYNTKKLTLYNGLFSLRVPKKWSVLQCPYIDFDTYIITPNEESSCSSAKVEKEGIHILNIPHCNIKLAKNRKSLKVKSKVTFYLISVNERNSDVPINEAVVASFEIDRCIIFIDRAAKEVLPLTNDLEDLLKSLK